MRNVIILLLIFSFVGCKSSNKEEIKLLFTGDILLSRNVKNEIQQKNNNPWINLTSEFKQADLVIGNLEGTIGVQSISNSMDKMVFDIPQNLISLLKEAGFSIMTLENNHINDLGLCNKDSTILKLNNTGIVPVSKRTSPWFYRIKNHTIAFIAINLIKDRFTLKDTVPSIDIQQKLHLAKNLSDFVIVSVHWGSELIEWPNNSQRLSAKWLIENGADLIIGHHPHVIQNPEIIDGKPVFYSLGNHLFDQKYLETKKGLIVECIIKNNRVHYKGLLTKTMKNSFFPELDTTVFFKLKKTMLHSEKRYYGYSIIPTSVIDGTIGKTVLSGYLKEKLTWRTQPTSLITFSDAKFDGQNKYLFTLENHYSSIDKENAPRPYVYEITNGTLHALWRGSALSRPLIDATLTSDKKYLIALHRKDSFININPNIRQSFVEIYKWNGFGFSGLKDSTVLNYANSYYR